MPKSVTFYSEGVKLAGDLLLPADIKPGERRAGIVLCHGYTGLRSIYLPDNARVLVQAVVHRIADHFFRNQLQVVAHFRRDPMFDQGAVDRREQLAQAFAFIGDFDPQLHSSASVVICGQA